MTVVVNREWLHKLARRLGMSTRVGSVDLWDFVFGWDGHGAWVTVRDDLEELSYLGWVKAASDNSNEPELFLRDVTVTDDDGNELYEVPGLYLRRAPDALTVEIEEGIIDSEHLTLKKEE